MHHVMTSANSAFSKMFRIGSSISMSNFVKVWPPSHKGLEAWSL